MSVVIISGSAGLIGAEAARHFAAQGLDVVGIDNDMGREFFGAGASTTDSRLRLLLGIRSGLHPGSRPVRPLARPTHAVSQSLLP